MSRCSPFEVQLCDVDRAVLGELPGGIGYVKGMETAAGTMGIKSLALTAGEQIAVQGLANAPGAICSFFNPCAAPGIPYG